MLPQLILVAGALQAAFVSATPSTTHSGVQSRQNYDNIDWDAMDWDAIFASASAQDNVEIAAETSAPAPPPPTTSSPPESTSAPANPPSEDPPSEYTSSEDPPAQDDPPADGGMGNTVLENRCDYDLWVWTVDQHTGSSEAISVPSHSKHVEPKRKACDGCGVVLKVSKTDQLVHGKQTQMEYVMSGGKLWYDISYVNCADGEDASNCPGHDGGVTMDSPDSSCRPAECAANSYCPHQAYYVDFPVQKLGLEDPVFDCGDAGTAMDLHMKICSEGPAQKRSIAGRIAV